jgi:endonuclease-3
MFSARAWPSGRWRAGCARSGRLAEAEAMQRSLADELAAAGETDGFVFEELAEIELARGNPAAAAPWAAKAWAALKDDRNLAANEPARLARPGRSRQHAAMNAAKRRAIFERLRAANPNPTTELVHSSPYELLVAVVLSAQATDRSVNLSTAKLFPVANTPAKIARLGVAGLTPYISSIGLYRNKAKNVVALSEILLAEHGGNVPQTRESARGAARRRPEDSERRAQYRVRTTDDRRRHAYLPGRQPDGLAPGDDVVEVERKLEKFVPEEFRQDCHHWLILHGRYVCTARAPKCGECVIVELCEYRHKNLGIRG